MNDPATDDMPGAMELSGIPGLGPVRRRLLAEAGIRTHSEFTQATLEQIISVTGMPRTAAEQAQEFTRRNTLPDTVQQRGGKVETVTEEDTGTEAVIAFEQETVERDKPTTLGDDAPQTTRLERATLRAQTAIADASRRTEPGSKLSEMLLRFARLTDELPRRVTTNTRGGVIKRITERIETIAERLEMLAASKKEPGPLSTKRAKRLQQRLKRTRDSIKRTLKTSASN